MGSRLVRWLVHAAVHHSGFHAVLYTEGWRSPCCEDAFEFVREDAFAMMRLREAMHK